MPRYEERVKIEMRKRMVKTAAAAWMFAVLICVMAFSALSGCGEQGGEGDDKPLIMATIFPQYDLARSIAGDRARVELLIKPGGESHSYEPTPADIIKITDCDLFLYIGGESDVWADDILDSLGKQKDAVLALIDCVPTLDEEQIVGAEETEEPETDEHIWTSPKNALLMAAAIYEKLCVIDPDNAPYYSENYEKLAADITLLDEDIRAFVETAPRKTIVVADRFPFLYFAREYGLDYAAAFPGCSSETEPSIKTMTYIVDKIKSENIPVVFYIEGSTRKLAETICGDTGAKALLLHSCHNVSADEIAGGETYVSLMRANLSNLKEALG